MSRAIPKREAAQYGWSDASDQLLRDSVPPSAIATPTTATKTLASALISGLTPRRTFEKITIGKVVAAGPVTKEEITRSSTDKVKASSQPASRAGAIRG